MIKVRVWVKVRVRVKVEAIIKKNRNGGKITTSISGYDCQLGAAY